ncbi:MAG: hydroxyacid dehydrogenase [Clostridia bacterium]|nr:hydroxyacid dehydrogenase [Clostridia bacterium]
MVIKILDRATLGADTPIELLSDLGELEIYETSTSAEAKERIVGADVVIINKVKLTREIISCSGKLRLICVFATGFDNVDLNASRERGIAVCNVPGYSSDSVALITASTVLSLITHLSVFNEFVKSGEYTQSGTPNRLVPVFHELTGKTWGIVGYGGIGSAVGRIAKAFGVRLIVNKRTDIDGVECVDIDTLCKESDIITLHCPLNDSTRHLINRERLSLMKSGAILVNEARGDVVNETDVVDAVLSGKLAGYGCDVYSTEPFGIDHPYNKIKDLPNVILTPHCAWGSYEARVRCLNIIIENIKAYYNGDIKNRVDI